jgi:hypothetical protein
MGSEPMKIWSVCGAERTGLKVGSERQIDTYSTRRNFIHFLEMLVLCWMAASGWIGCRDLHTPPPSPLNKYNSGSKHRGFLVWQLERARLVLRGPIITFI